MNYPWRSVIIIIMELLLFQACTSKKMENDSPYDIFLDGISKGEVPGLYSDLSFDQSQKDVLKKLKGKVRTESTSNYWVLHEELTNNSDIRFMKIKVKRILYGSAPFVDIVSSLNEENSLALSKGSLKSISIVLDESFKPICNSEKKISNILKKKLGPPTEGKRLNLNQGDSHEYTDYFKWKLNKKITLSLAESCLSEVQTMMFYTISSTQIDMNSI